MNDDELNALIARSEEEGVLFRQLDLDRERDAEDNWRAHGHRGKHPPPLMQLEELPDCYRNDEVFEVQEMDEIAEGRGQRKRNVVSYNDGLSDDAWALVCIFFWFQKHHEC
jgi:ATP-dependent helicase STH1/SNF2